MPPARKTPQDRKPKATEPGGFTFEHDGDTYTLPAPSEALTQIPGRALRDALLDGEEGQLRLAFRCVEATDVTDETLDALYDKPAPEMTAIIMDWFRSADASGATLPE